MKLNMPAGVKSVRIRATIVRADGRVEPLGTVAYWHANPLVRWWHAVKTWWRGLTGRPN